MKLSWRDLVNTALLTIGGFFVYANLANFSASWLNDWRITTVLVAGIGLAMCIVAAGDIENKSILNRVEMFLGTFVILAAFFAVITGWQWAGLAVAGVVGSLWLISTARHTRHSLIHETSKSHHGAYAH